MVNRDAYEAIMDEFVARMEKAVSAFDEEMRHQSQRIAELVDQQELAELQGLAERQDPVDQPDSAVPMPSRNEKAAAPDRSDSGARLFD